MVRFALCKEIPVSTADFAYDFGHLLSTADSKSFFFENCHQQEDVYFNVNKKTTSGEDITNITA